jgi:hypothetical protein
VTKQWGKRRERQNDETDPSVGIFFSDRNLAAKHVLNLVHQSSSFNRPRSPRKYGQALLGGIKRLVNGRNDSRDEIGDQLVLWSDEVGYTL